MEKRIVNYFLLLFFLVGCVGSVEEGEPDIRNVFTSGENEPPAYTGIEDAYAVAHNRFEIIFETLDGEKFDHYLYVNQATVPIKIDLEDPDLVRLSGGRYLYTYIQGKFENNFNFIGNEHVFKIRAQDKESQKWTKNENEIVAKGLNNRVSYFDGINSVEAFPGAVDSKVTVQWSTYPMEGTFIATESDSVYYIVTYIEASEGYDNLYNPDYSGSKRFSERIPSAGRATPTSIPNQVVISGLKEDTEYLFSVRAIHKKYADEVDAGNSDISFLPEQNTRFISYTTGSSTSIFDLSANALTLDNGIGANGLTSVRASWESGVGTYFGYRIYYREYTGGSDPAADDKLDLIADLIPLGGVCNTGGTIKCEEYNATETSAIISSLSSYSTYQFKLVLCYSAACELDPLAVVAPDRAAIVTNLQTQKVEPILANFSGIENLWDPTDASDLDKIDVKVYAPATSIGYTDTMEFYCFDPSDKTNYVAFPQNGSAIISTIPECNGLSIRLESGAALSSLTPANISSLLDYDIQGVVADGNTEYCLQAVDAITKQGASNIVRQAIDGNKASCFYPVINTPSVDQFKGVSSCSVSDDQITVSWQLPSGGIFNRFKVYWKEKDAFVFNFEDAIAPTADYNTHGSPTYLADNVTSFTIPNLTPGKSYDVGVLAWAIGGASTPSEFNTSIKNCTIDFPVASFKKWHRVFAIGPKIDGRFNLDNAKNNLYNGYKDNAYLSEFIDRDGVPMEFDGVTHLAPPGQYNGSPPTTFTEAFDGSFNNSGQARSSTGIVSLAWEEVDLDYAVSSFQSGQNFGVRGTRTFGYKVFRSYNNGLDWVDLTANSGLIHAGNYTYLPRSNATATSDEITTRMAFFTDYSVEALSGDQDVERARVVLYKIVPFFDNTVLEYQGSQFNKHHIIKVVLPPANMALVNRMISNKTLCEEMDKTIDVDNHYVCEFNGLGAKPRTLPWTLGNTVVDQGGDLLVDRFELGCNYTRGDLIQNPQVGRSWIDETTAPYSSDTYSGRESAIRKFDGLNTVDSSPLKGCYNEQFSLTSRFITTPFGSIPSEREVLYGDCIGSNFITMPFTAQTGSYIWRINLNVPGVPNNVLADFDPTLAGNTDPTDPQIAFGDDSNGRYSFFGDNADFRRNILTQSEYAAVFYNQSHASNTHILSPRGPDETDPTGTTMKALISGSSNPSVNEGVSAHQSCFINLAAIGADGAQRARWFPASYMSDIVFNNSNLENLYTKTLGEIQTANNFYNTQSTSEFKPIPSGQWDSSRIDSSMLLPRVFSSNSSKLPPLRGLTHDSFNKVCQSYKLQVGESDDGVSFSPRSKAYKKRLLRRSEFIASSSFPNSTSYNESTISNIERGDTGSIPGACASSNHSNITVANTATTQSSLDSKSTSSVVANSPFHTGSGLLDSNGNTRYCASKYGVQDLIGNAQEALGDQIQCDYSLDQLYFGEYNSLGQFGVPSQSVLLSNYPYGEATYYWEDLKIYDDLGNDITPSNPRPWARVDPNSGYCSIVDITESHLQNSNFRSGSSFYDFEDLSTDPLFSENTLDPNSIFTQRNGEGTFSAFGVSALLPEFKYNNALAISSAGITAGDPDQGKGNYFSSLLGLPLSCPSSTPNYDPCGSDALDNKLLTTSFLNSRNAPDLTNTSITNFPTHNSQILNTGIASVNRGPQSPVTWDPSNTTSFREIITEIHLNNPPGGSNLAGLGGYNVTRVDSSNTGVFTGATESYYDISWSILRDSRLTMDSGGSYISGTTGRYSLEANTSRDMFSYNSYNRRTVAHNGARCAVLIEE